MQTYFSLTDLAITKPSTITIGNFDGVHIGHQLIIRSRVEAAKVSGRHSVLITFFPNLKAIFCKDRFIYLTSNAQKLELI
ncbi:MAG: hypothetical protein GYA34_18430 [Chloroflexi bacterium]|nr:hypothetical protein [Chloroflexota bacterium]